MYKQDVNINEKGYRGYHTHASSSAWSIALDGLLFDTARGQGRLVTLQ